MIDRKKSGKKRPWRRRADSALNTTIAIAALAVLSHASTAWGFGLSVPPFSRQANVCTVHRRRVTLSTSLSGEDKESAPSSFAFSDPWEGPKYNISLLLIDHYDSFTYNLYDYFAQLLVEPPVVIAKDAFDTWNASDFQHLDGIVLSPGPGTPQEQPPLSHQAILQNPDLPILGVCLGHQLLALNYGAKVEKAPTPIHGQDHWITQTAPDEIHESPLFRGLPTSFRVVRYHSLAACDDDLPLSLQVTARSKGDGVIQAMQHISNPHYGVQFHPESIGTQHGMAILKNFCQIVESHKRKRWLESTRTNQGESSSADYYPLARPSSSSLRIAKPRFRVMAHPFKAAVNPEQVFDAVYNEESHAMWLDSSSASSQRGELDILAAPCSSEDILEYHHQGSDTSSSSLDILSRLEQELFGATRKDDGNRRPASNELAMIRHLSSDPIEFQSDDQIDATLPFHYRGGYLGYLGYEVRHDTERYLHQVQGGRPMDETLKSGSTYSDTPTAAFFLARNSLVYHHPTTTWYMVSLVEQDEECDNALEWMKTTKERILGVAKELQTQDDFTTGDSNAPSPTATTTTPLAFVPNRSKATYEADIAKCHEFIRQGESYELCLTNQLEAQLPEPRSTWDLYKILRRRNPAPYSAYFRWKATADNDMTICCSSPERFMSVQRKQPHPEVPMVLQAEAKPIKGTEARVMPQNGVCLTEAENREDQRRARGLELSLKNRAENLMIVDLLRNDLSRVCQVGTVHVSKLMAIESFATVHQMVSTIRGTLATVLPSDQNAAQSSTSIDLLRAAFPGGSMTGAPKIRSMELLDELEQGIHRGPYAGSLGYLSANGCMDMNIIIRSAVITIKDGEEQRIRVGAGGAITALSEVQDEYDEMLLKARAVVQAVQEWAAARSGSPETDAPKEVGSREASSPITDDLRRQGLL